MIPEKLILNDDNLECDGINLFLQEETDFPCSFSITKNDINNLPETIKKELEPYVLDLLIYGETFMPIDKIKLLEIYYKKYDSISFL